MGGRRAGRLVENRATCGRKTPPYVPLVVVRIQATWDEVTEEARRRFANLSRVK